ncbi:MAG: 5-formyltetrahydrofolate cyclo-ligase [Coriobacteriales bacterium]|jgi:septum formation protein
MTQDEFPAGKGTLIVLASASPRRRDMFEREGFRFACLVPGVDESVDGTLPPETQAERVALSKARGALELLGGDDSHPIVSCDTMVVHGGRIFGKPQTAEEARAMLGELSGSTHQVVSGVCIFAHGKAHAFHEVTDVTFRPLSAGEIEDYIASGEPFDKAGGYGIQGAAGAFVNHIEGDYDNVVGFPLARFLDELAGVADTAGVDDGKGYARKLMKAVRKSIPASKRADASRRVCELIAETPEFAQARVVAAYTAFGSELCFDALATDFPADKRLVVPVTMADRRMEFVYVEPQSILPGASDLDFLKDPAGITTLPEGFEIADASDIDLMFVPGLAFDSQGYRMGYGGGYYDTYLTRPDFHGTAFGTFFAAQQFYGGLPHEEHDIPLPRIISA